MQLVHEFETNGFVFCEGFARERVAEIVTELDRMIRDVVPTMASDQVFYENKRDVTSLKQLQHLEIHDAYFTALADQGPFRELAETLLGESVTCQNIQYFNKPPGIGKPTPAHQDGYYFCLDPPSALTMWLALETVDEENGCVRYVPQSHLAGLRPHGPTDTLGFSQGILDYPSASDAAAEVAQPAAAGDLLAHHAYTIHRADGNQSPTRTRRALGLIYHGESAVEDVEARARYKEQLRAMQSGRI